MNHPTPPPPPPQPPNAQPGHTRWKQPRIYSHTVPVPFTRTDCLKHSFFHRTPIIRNSLPPEVAAAPSLDIFKSQLAKVTLSLHFGSSKSHSVPSYYQVEAEAELRGWQGFRGRAQIRSHAETTDHSRKLASALVCWWSRSGHVTRSSAWLIPHLKKKITNHNQHAFNIKYLANLFKKYWTCFRYQKLADFLVCFPPSIRVHVRWPPSWKICLRIQLTFGFWGRAVKAFGNFSRKLAWLFKTIF